MLLPLFVNFKLPSYSIPPAESPPALGNDVSGNNNDYTLSGGTQILSSLYSPKSVADAA